ncbi:hypothetical protein RCO27_02140 [Sphingosinicella sp. LHD-64]|nr:hypothetical protein [Sphingosinicella sp. LHD-64]MDQ8755017.1 hypothetical protein [Sphingosinicella sp. LHD-64]
MLACTLPKAEWTHEAHLSTCAWLVLERPDIVPERDLPHLIRRYNESVGGVNDETQGYHETITQISIRAVHEAQPGAEKGTSIAENCAPPHNSCVFAGLDRNPALHDPGWRNGR